MDNEKIGLFIAEQRKVNKLTQEELARKLHVTNQAVSKWEKGICFPDISVVEPLCEELGITLFEFFKGMKFKDSTSINYETNNIITDTIGYSKKQIIEKKKLMKKKMIVFFTLIVLLIILFLGIKVNNEIRLDKFRGLLGYTQEEVYEKVGKPKTTSNGCDLYKLNNKQISVCYDESKIVTHININGEYIMNSRETADYLFDFKAPYIGDNSTIGKLLDILDIGMYGHYTFQLQTDKKPYVLIINYSLIEGWGSILNNPETIIEKSAILLALIDNVDEIHWVLPDNKEVHKITVSDLLDKYGNIKDYGKSVQHLKQLLIKLDYYEEDETITMSIKDLTNTGLTLIITNHANNDYLYGAFYSLQRRENGVWVEVEEIVDNCAFFLIGYTLKANQIVEEKYSWEICKGKLPAGQYRITKFFNYIIPDSNGFEHGKKHIISAEFVI